MSTLKYGIFLWENNRIGATASDKICVSKKQFYVIKTAQTRKFLPLPVPVFIA